MNCTPKKSLLHSSYMFVILLLFIGCGQLDVTPAAKEATLPPEIASRKQNKCPMQFPVSGICSSATWSSPPSISASSILTITFWKQGTSTLVDPPFAPSLLITHDSEKPLSRKLKHTTIGTYTHTCRFGRSGPTTMTITNKDGSDTVSFHLNL